MRSSKNSHLIEVQDAQYRWRAKGNDNFISISIWPANNTGPFISGRLGYHQTWVDNGDGISSSAGNQIVVTSRLVRRIIARAITSYRYDPNKKGKQLNLGALEELVKWDDAVRASTRRVEAHATH